MIIKEKKMNVTREQVKKLESLLFWRREIRLINNMYGSNPVECEYWKGKADDAIRYKMNECDKLGIPHYVQNVVMMYEDVHSDILDVLRDKEIGIAAE